MLEPAAIHAWIPETFEGVNFARSWGEHAWFYNPGNAFPRGSYFLTIKELDGDNDRASNLTRPGFWRLNLGLPKSEFVALFGQPPTRPDKGGVIEGIWDFETPDQLTPHPVYGWMCWVAILNPSPETFESLKPLVALAYTRAREGLEKREARNARWRDRAARSTARQKRRTGMEIAG